MAIPVPEMIRELTHLLSSEQLGEVCAGMVGLTAARKSEELGPIEAAKFLSGISQCAATIELDYRKKIT